MKIELCRFNNQSSLLFDAIEIYCTIWGHNKDDSTIFFRKYTQQTDFLGYIACVENQAVGFAMGTASQEGQWWHDKVAKNIGDNHPALIDAWVLIELGILEDYRHQQVGTILHNHILSIQPYPNALLSTQVNNIPARKFYEKYGWYYLHYGMVFNKNREQYCIMGKNMDKR